MPKIGETMGNYKVSNCDSALDTEIHQMMDAIIDNWASIDADMRHNFVCTVLDLDVKDSIRLLADMPEEEPPSSVKPETLRPLHGKTNRQANEASRIFRKDEEADLVERMGERTAYTGKCPNCDCPFVNTTLPVWSDGWVKYCKCDNCGEFYREFWAAEDVIVDRLDPKMFPVKFRAVNEASRIFRKDEEEDLIEDKGCQPRKTRWTRSIGVVRKTFEEVLDVLSDWHEKGYRLRSVEWNGDTQQYTIQGDQDVLWVCE